MAGTHLFFGGLSLNAHERIQIEKDADHEQEAAEAHKEDKSNRSAAQEAQPFHQQAENQNDPRNLETPLERAGAGHYPPPFQNVASFSFPTSCTTPWHPLEMQDVLFAFSAGSKSGSAVCTAPSSKERAPAWQCRHARLLYGSYSLMFSGA